MIDGSGADNKPNIDTYHGYSPGMSTGQPFALNRRQFIQASAVACGLGLLPTGPAIAADSPDAAWEQWNATLFDRGSTRWYSGAELKHISMPMGGIGAGQVYVSGRGGIGPWQIVNNFNSNGYAPGGMFGIWARNGAGAVARVLEEKTAESVLPSVESVEFAGEYPFAWIRYHDKALPVEVTLECYSPFIPLETKDSALPVVIFRFNVKNVSTEATEAAVMASMPNLIGWNGYTQLRDHTHAGYIGNVNEKLPDAEGLRFTTRPGALASMAKPCSLVTDSYFVADAMQICKNLTVSRHEGITHGQASKPDVYWLATVHEYDKKTGLMSVLDAVEQGAAIIVGTGQRDLLSVLRDPENSFRQDVVKRWRVALPITWRSLEPTEQTVQCTFNVTDDVHAAAMTLRWRGRGLKPKRGAHVLCTASDGTPLIVERAYGKGRIITVLGDPDGSVNPYHTRRLIADLVARAANTTYAPQQGWEPDAPFYGSMVLAAIGESGSTSYLPQWNDAKALWRDFAEDGRFDSSSNASPGEPGATWNGAMSIAMTLEPGAERDVTLALTWHFPNRMRDFRYLAGPQMPQYDFRLGNQYNNWFTDAAEVFQYVAQHFERLDRTTRLFHHTFYDSTLPQWLLDAVTANLSIVRSPTIMWLEDGTVAGFEGTDSSYPMNCTHVYNYAMSMAYIFPALERNMREIDLTWQMHPEEHFIPHRTIVPLELPRLGNTIFGPLHHALDGELGTILKAYREWKFSGDTAWLQSLWGNAKLVMRHVLDDHDVDGDGVIKGEQPNTYDIQTYGSNTFIGSLYLAALLATEEMARHFGDNAFADECRARFERGTVGYDEKCWFGSYYRHRYDSPGVNPAIYEAGNSWGDGCHADQVFGQWWAHILNLGYVLPPERVKTALASIYNYNWRRDFRGYRHNRRVFAEGDERGLLCCTWPQGGQPQTPVRYFDEVWTGIEYHVAASLIREGLVREGLHIARGVRDRYNGEKRNPWAEEESGWHYARAMAAHSLLLLASGVYVDMVSRALRYAPAFAQDNFKAFFSTGTCWGSLVQRRERGTQHNQISVAYGTLELEQLELESSGGKRVTVEGPHSPRVRTRHIDGQTCMLVFERPVTLNAGESLTVRIA